MSLDVLTEHEMGIVRDRLEPQLQRIERSGETEDQKLRIIGMIVEGIITDLRDPLYGRSKTVRPSVLPKHDDVTIGRMADWQRKLREAGLAPEVQALQLERLEAYELFVQSQDRKPPEAPKEDAGCFVDVGEYDF